MPTKISKHSVVRDETLFFSRNREREGGGGDNFYSDNLNPS